MMRKLSFFGIGPKMAVVLLPWFTASIIISRIMNDIFAWSKDGAHLLIIPGIIMLAAGLILYTSTVRQLLNGIKETRLITSGVYGKCRNPLYAAIILLIIPSISLILNSWLILTSSVVAYILFKLLIKDEYNELERVFGEEFLRYKGETPEFFPVHRNSKSLL